MNIKKYHLAALGGTFDHFHKGHQTLINHALKAADKVIIGLTSNDLVCYKRFSNIIQPYSKRIKVVKKFLADQKVDTRVHFVTLNDIFGPTLYDKSIKALIVSPLTYVGAELVNKTRVKLDLSPLPIEVCHLELANDYKHISSTRIRLGLINRDGFVYQDLFDSDIKLSPSQSQQLKQPLGLLLKNSQLNKLTKYLKKENFNLAIGDETSKFSYQNNLPINVCIFDDHIQRKKVGSSIQHLLTSSEISLCNNKSGMITTALAKKISRLYPLGKHIKINGEEDLAVLPAIALLPLGSTIIYGQPHQGIVYIPVTEEKKEWVKKLLYRLGD